MVRQILKEGHGLSTYVLFLETELLSNPADHRFLCQRSLLAAERKPDDGSGSLQGTRDQQPAQITEIKEMDILSQALKGNVRGPIPRRHHYCLQFRNRLITADGSVLAPWTRRLVRAPISRNTPESSIPGSFRNSALLG